MNNINNQNGFALITSLMFTMISLVITMSLLYMVSLGVKSSGVVKRYRSTTEAAYGGVDLLIKDIINTNLVNATSSITSVGFNSQINGYISGLGGVTMSQTATDCLRTKLTTPTLMWASCGSNNTLNANDQSGYDLKLQLSANSGTPFNVYAKIVDTMQYSYDDFTPDGKKVTLTSAGNTDLSGIHLEGAGVVSGGNGNSNPSQPYMYRIEVQAERPASSEKSKISVEYIF